MMKVRLGLVGCGKRGIGVTRLFMSHPGYELVALMDRYPSCCEAAAQALGVGDEVGVYTDFGRLLREGGVDAIYFACDPTVQVGLACEAMEAGKHVCTDVPAAFSMEELWRLIETVERTGMRYQLMEQTRYWGFVDGWTAMRERGEFGHICMAQGEYIHYERDWGYWTDLDTGEILSDLVAPAGRRVEAQWRQKVLAEPIYYLPHTLSPLLKILGDRVATVSCQGTRKPSYTYEDVQLPWSDIQYALMHTAGDTVLLAGAGFSLPYVQRGVAGAHWYEVRGTRASVESPRCRDDAFRVWRPGMDTYAPMAVGTVPLDATAEQSKSGHGGADFKPVASFYTSIVENTAPPVDVYLAAEITAPAILAAESARQGGAVLAVPDFRGR